MSVIEKIAATYTWQKALGHEVQDTGLCRIVRNLDLPLIWDANHVSLIRATSEEGLASVFQDEADLLGNCGHSVVHVDPLTPPLVEARLAAADYEDQTPILQMVLSGDLKVEPTSLDIRPVTQEEDWSSLGEMIHENFVETGPALSTDVALDISHGLLAANRLKAADFRFYIARIDGQDCGYGGGGLCPDGMGIVEDIFTRPGFRHRGVATAVIARAVTFSRSRGAGDVLIGTSASDTVKHLYGALGFRPVCITRKYVKEKAWKD
jgi:GNAT superfamily N-acetyltransferase